MPARHRPQPLAAHACRVVHRDDRGTRIALTLAAPGGVPVEFEIAPGLAERLAYALHHACRCAAVDPAAFGDDLVYRADDAHLRFDATTGSGELTFSSRQCFPMRVRLGLNELIGLRQRLGRVA